MRKRIFLTSMLALAVASPAFAAEHIQITDQSNPGYAGVGFIPANITTEQCTGLNNDDTSPYAGGGPLWWQATNQGSGTYTLTARWIADECEINLDKNNSNATDPNPTKLWTTFGVGVYKTSAKAAGDLMTDTNSVGMTAVPVGQSVSVTWNNNAGSHASDVTTTTNSTGGSGVVPFQGFYQNSDGTGSQYISATGYITSSGNTAGKAVAKNNNVCNNPTWYGKWGCINYTNPVLSLDGYTFEGWFTDPTDGTQDTGGCTDSSKTLYAHWTPNKYKVTYDCGGHYNSSTTWGSGTAGLDNNIEYDTDSYTFRGTDVCYWEGHQPSSVWTCHKEGDSSTTVATTTQTPWTTPYNVVCEVSWAGLHNLSYNCNNDEAGTDSSITTTNTTQHATGELNVQVATDQGACNTPTGKTFGGWNCPISDNSNEDVTTGGTFTMPDRDVECTASWTPNTINLKWRATEVNYNSTTSCTYGTAANATSGNVQTPNNLPSRTGYSFDGWEVIDWCDHNALAGEPNACTD